MEPAANLSHVEAVLDALDFKPRDRSNHEEILEAREWAAYRAAVILEELPDGASRATFIEALRRMFPALAPRAAERIVDGVIRRSARRPPKGQFMEHPTQPLAFALSPEPAEKHVRLRRLAINMFLEKRAARPMSVPQHEPEGRLTVGQAQAEVDANVEARRRAMGLPSGLLRTVDYEPGATHTAPRWLVKGLFPNRGLGLLVGESQAGKSFLAIHASVCVARGLPFFGKKTKPGGVLYVAAEGGSGVLPRIQAADAAVGGILPDNHILRAGCAPLARAPIKVVVETPNLSRDGDPRALARTIRTAAREFAEAGHTLALVVVDTWHAALGGADEQAAADAGHALKPFREAMEELGVFTLIVHHPGKDLERGARGSSALRAAVDTEIELRVPGFDGPKAKPAAFARRGVLTKQRDGAVGDEFHYRLNVVELGRDEDGDPWTTCTVLPCDAPELGAAGKPKGKGASRFMKAVEAGLGESSTGKADMRVVRGYFNNAGPAGEKDDARRKAFRRAFDTACTAGQIETDSCEQFIWPTSSSAARDTGQTDTP